ncbi:MAG: insulinase family protein [Candidatus Kerfeldbacteria bacterium]|nr:insulinase family protein [Candidatus Kerfeldbacteria bacterium]
MSQFSLPNGLTVVLLPWASLSATAAVGIRSGSRDDPVGFHGSSRLLNGSLLAGVNHFGEHAFFRATRRHPTWAELARDADSLCSNYNAYTDWSTQLYVMESDRRRVRGMLRLLGEIIRSPRLTAENVAFERERIRQECREFNDEPQERALLDLHRLMFPANGLGHPILGTERTIERITIDHLRALHRRAFVGRRMVLVLAGGFEPELVKPVIRQVFGPIRAGTSPPKHSLDFHEVKGGLHLFRDGTHQLHCLVGWPTPGVRDRRRPAIGLIRNMLSHRTSSWLKLGLDSFGHGYSLSDTCCGLEDIGWYSIYFPMSGDHLREAAQIIGRQLQRLREHLVSTEELDLAVTNLSIDTRSRFSEPWASAMFAAQQVLNLGRFIPVRQYLHLVRGFSRRQLRTIAREVLDPQRMTMVIRGPVNGLRRAQILRALDP